MIRNCIGGMTLEDWKNRLSELCETIGKIVLSANKAMTEFLQSDVFKQLVDFFSNIPDDIQETELFQHIISLEKAEITYNEIEWLQEMLGYQSYDASVNDLRSKEEKSELDKYVLSIIESELISPREKIIVLLAHFESLVYQVMTYERKSWDKVKRIVSQNANDSHEMEMESYTKILLAGIVFVVFSDTDNYKNEIDKRIPFRNNILHRGVMIYSDEEIKEAYELLVYFIAELSLIEK